jgi:glycosyltransferase involved in cell wall biosynthesis
MPRVVLGLPMYRSEEVVAEVLESLLSLEYDDFGVLALDDCSPDATFAIASSYADSDPRLIVEANPRRVGMIENWNRVLARAYELFPEFEFFAWASDNDFREPSWIAALTRALEEDPRAALAYSRFGTIENGVKNAPPGRWLFDSHDIGDSFERLRATMDGMRAGPTMYGLHRRSTLEQAGDVPRVLLSDVLFLSHLSLYGTFLQVPEVLWYRGSQKTGGSIRRQRAALFSDPPLSTFLPVSLQHTRWLLQTMVFGRRRPPGVGGVRALFISCFYLLSWWTRLFRRALTANRKWRRKQRKTWRRRQTRVKKYLRAKSPRLVERLARMRRRG